MGNNLRKLRADKGWTHDQAAEALGVSRGQFIKLERGERRLTSDYIAQAARAFGVPEIQVISEPSRDVPLVGYVGAGSLASIYSDGQGPFDEVPAPDDATDKTVAVEVRGSSLGELFDQWIVFYDDVRDPPRSAWLGKLCVVGCADGRILIKKLTRGQLPGTYTLISNTEPPIYDVPVAWAALVKTMRPR
jgi:transcriptional regulator with XRE-family HTH domain